METVTQSMSGSSRSSRSVARIIAVAALALAVSSLAFAQDAGREALPERLPLMQTTIV